MKHEIENVLMATEVEPLTAAEAGDVPVVEAMPLEEEPLLIDTELPELDSSLKEHLETITSSTDDLMAKNDDFLHNDLDGKPLYNMDDSVLKELADLF